MSEENKFEKLMSPADGIIDLVYPQPQQHLLSRSSRSRLKIDANHEDLSLTAGVKGSSCAGRRGLKHNKWVAHPTR